MGCRRLSAVELRGVLGLGSYEARQSLGASYLARNGSGTVGWLAGFSAGRQKPLLVVRTADKGTVLVTAREGDRLRLIHAQGNCIEHIGEEQVEADAVVKTNDRVAHNTGMLKAREHDGKVRMMYSFVPASQKD